MKKQYPAGHHTLLSNKNGLLRTYPLAFCYQTNYIDNRRSKQNKLIEKSVKYLIPFYLQEPHTNGPLFTELAFYQRVAKPELSMTKITFTKLTNNACLCA